MKKLTAGLSSIGLILMLTAAPTFAATLYWDPDVTAEGNDAETGAGLGGTGTWDTTLLNWWDGISADQAWVNANADDAVIMGGTQTVTLTGAITANSLTFNNQTGNASLAGAVNLVFAAGTTGYGAISNLTAFVGNSVATNYIANLITNPGASHLYVTGPGLVVFGNTGNNFSNLVVDAGTVQVNAGNSTTGLGPLGYQTSHATNIVLQNSGKVRIQSTGAGRNLFGKNQHITIGSGGGVVELFDSAMPAAIDGSGGVGVSTCTINIGANTLTVQGKGVWGIAGTSLNSPASVQGSSGGTLLVKDTAVIRLRSYAERLYSAIKLDLASASSGFEFSVSGNQTIAELTGTGYISSQTGVGTLIVKPGSGVTSTFSGKFCDAHVTKDGSGTLIVDGPAGTGVSTHNFTVSAGTLRIGSNTALAGHTLRFNGGTIRTTDTTARTLANPVNFFGSSQTLGANSTGNLTFTGAFAMGGVTSTLTVNGVRITFSGVASGAAGLIRAGNSTGTLVFSGANTFGSATVGFTNNSGTLLINNTTGSGLGNASLLNAATFGGTGRMTGSVTNQGTINPGDSTVNNGVGTLSIGGNLQMATASTLKVDIYANAASQGVNQDYMTNAALVIDGAWTLAVNGPAGNTFADDTLDYSYTILTADGGITGFDANNVTITSTGLATGNGAFRVRQSDNSLILDYIHPPYITASTIGQSVDLGAPANMSVTAAGTGTLIYQWKKDGNDISGETTSAYSIAAVQLTDAGTYSCVVTGDYTPAATPSGILAIRPYFTLQPVGSTNNPGDSVTFTVTAEGSGTLAYQWNKDGVTIPGATLNALTFNPVRGTNAAEELGYTVQVSNDSDATITSDPAILRVTPEIVTTLPANTYAYAGDVTLTIEATGTTNLYYAWYKDSVALNDDLKYGATTNTPSLTISNVIVGTDNGTYSVIVTNLVGSNTNSTYLTVTETPAIVTQPQSTTNVSGTTATFTVSAVGSPPLFYQWRKGGVDVAGGTESTLTLLNVQTADEAGYDVIVSNEVSSVVYSVTSAPPAMLTVYYPLTATDPGDQTTVSNTTATFTVTITSVNNGPTTYQWQKNGANISDDAKYLGTAGLSLQVLNAVQADEGTYSLISSAYAGSITNSGTLTVNDPPAVTGQPATVNTGNGTNATFSVTVVGTPPFSYQWQSIIGGVTNDVAGETSSSVIISASHSVEGQYQCVITNDAGSTTSAPADLFVYDVPQIGTQPTSLLVTNNDTAVFTVTAAQNTTPGAPLTLSYQWKNGGSSYAGATTDSLTISNAQLSDQSTNIVVVVTNVAGAVTSSPVSLTVYQSIAISKQPTPEMSVRVNTDALLSVTAVGNPLNYQWYKNGDAISGATHATFTNTTTTASEFGFYHVIIDNLFGAVTSSTSVLGAHWTNAWELATGSRSYLTTGDNNRGMAYNPATGHLLVPNSPLTSVPTIGIVDAATGADLGTLNITGIPAATSSDRAVLRIVANEDGVIYGCKLVVSTGSILLWRWQDESSAPVQVYNPTISGTTRWGDVLSIRGVGNSTEILISGGSGTSTAALLKTTSDGASGSWSFVSLTGTPAFIVGEFYNGFYFGETGDTFHTKSSTSETNKFWSYDGTGASTLTSTRAGFDPSLVGVNEDFANDLLYGVNFNTHALKMYDVSGSTMHNIVSYTMPTANANINLAGSIVGGPTDMVIGLEGNNGLLALQKQSLPTITLQPLDVVAPEAGSNVTFTVAIDQSVAYVVWKKDGVTIPGQNGTTLTVSNVAKADEGTYHAIVVSGVYPSTSTTATLSGVTGDPKLISSPSSQTVTANQSANLSVLVAGTGMVYEWKRNGSTISGATASTYTIEVADTVADAGSYTVIGTGTYGTITSDEATLTVNQASLAVNIDNKIKEAGTANPTFTGSVGSNPHSITIGSFTTDAITESPAGLYTITAILDDPNSELHNYTLSTNGGVLTVYDPVSITTPPASLTKYLGQSATFSVTATGGGTLAYQWVFSPLSGDPSSVVSTTSGHTISSVATNSAGTYTVYVSNDISTNSASATLTVLPDDTKPLLKVVKPLKNQIVLGGVPSLLITGLVNEASTPIVEYDLNTNGWTPVTTVVLIKPATLTLPPTHKWVDTITAGFIAGTNNLKIRARDVAGNISTNVFDTNIFWHVASPLTIIVKKDGVVDPVQQWGTVININKMTEGGIPGGTNLFVGRSYTLSTKVGAGTNSVLTNITYTAENPVESGELFVNTSGSDKSVITFTMKSNMNITFDFVDHGGITYGGVYWGLFSETAGGYKHSSAGMVTMKLDKKFKVSSGKMFLEGDDLKFSAKLDIAGAGSSNVWRTNLAVAKSALTLNLQADFSGLDKMTGTVHDPVGGWTSDLVAHRVTWHKDSNPATAYTNKYTLVLPGFEDDAQGPLGYSYGLITVDPKGVAKVLSGLGADGGKYKNTMPVISKNGHWPFYLSMYETKQTNLTTLKAYKHYSGVVMGWLQFAATTTNMTPAGTLNWIKVDGGTNYANGFTNLNMTAISSRYMAPITGSGNRVVDLNAGEGILTLSGVGVTETNVIVSLSTENKFIITNTVVGKVYKPLATTSSGALKGTFVIEGDPSTLKTTFYGAVLQDLNYGAGFFVRSAGSGVMTLDPTPIE